MIIAIPINGAVHEPQFGKSKVFEIADIDFENKRIASSRTVNLSSPGGALSLPESLSNEGVQVIVCGEISEQMFEDLGHVGIEVLSGAPVAPPNDLFAALLEGTVVEGGCGCGDDCGCDHESRDEGHGHGGCGSGCGCH
jgi:predicted Fe-Mo cluster-binding NifX family protein